MPWTSREIEAIRLLTIVEITRRRHARTRHVIDHAAIGGFSLYAWSDLDDGRRDPERKSKLRDRRKAAGVCVTCGELPPSDGTLACIICRARQKEWQNAHQRRVRAERRAAGLCTACGRPGRGKSLCARCVALQGERNRRRRQRAAASTAARQAGQVTAS